VKTLQLVQSKQAPVLSLKLSNRCRLDDPNYKYVKADFSDIRVRFEATRATQKLEKKAKSK
jgi:hypothetical protein